MKKKLQKWLINLIGPFVVKYYQKDFEALLKWSVHEQGQMLKEQIDHAKERGVAIEVHLDPTIVPMGMSIFHLVPNKPNLSIVPQDEDND